MEKVTLFENMINATARHTAIVNFAAIMGVDEETVHDLMVQYRAARRNEASEMILDFARMNEADAPRVLDAAGVRSVLVPNDNPASVKIVCAFLHAGWQSSATVIGYDDGDRKALRLSRA